MNGHYPLFLKSEYKMAAVADDDDVDSCISIMEAKLTDGEAGTTLASCEVYFVDFLFGQGFNTTHELLDIHGVTYEFSGLFNLDYCLQTKLAEKFDWFIPTYQLMIIHNLEVPKEHRGNKFSKLLIADIERRFANDNTLLALKAFPLEDRTPETTESLAKYYESIAFQKTGVNDILLRLQC